MRYSLIKKSIFAIIMSLLLLNMPFIQVIDASNKKEISVEIYAPNGIWKVTKNISIEAMKHIFSLMNKTNEKNIDELLSELNKYDLLGNFSIQEIKELITGEYLQKISVKKNEGLVNRMNLSKSIFNVFCFFGTGGFTWSFFPMNFIPMYTLYKFWGPLGPSNLFLALFLLLILCFGYIPHTTTTAFWMVKPTMTPQRVYAASVYTYGLFGEKWIETRGDSIYAITIGFTGIITTFEFIELMRGALGFTLFTYAYTK